MKIFPKKTEVSYSPSITTSWLWFGIQNPIFLIKKEALQRVISLIFLKRLVSIILLCYIMMTGISFHNQGLRLRFDITVVTI